MEKFADRCGIRLTEIHLNGKWNLHGDLFSVSSSKIRLLVSVYTCQIIVYKSDTTKVSPFKIKQCQKMGRYPFKRSPFVYKYVGVRVYRCCQPLSILLPGLVNRDVAEPWGEYFPWNLPACSHLSANIFHISLHKAATVQASRSIIASPGGRGFMKTTAFGMQLWFFLISTSVPMIFQRSY